MHGVLDDKASYLVFEMVMKQDCAQLFWYSAFVSVRSSLRPGSDLPLFLYRDNSQIEHRLVNIVAIALFNIAPRVGDIAYSALLFPLTDDRVEVVITETRNPANVLRTTEIRRWGHTRTMNLGWVNSDSDSRHPEYERDFRNMTSKKSIIGL